MEEEAQETLVSSAWEWLLWSLCYQMLGKKVFSQPFPWPPQPQPWDRGVFGPHCYRQLWLSPVAAVRLFGAHGWGTRVPCTASPWEDVPGRLGLGLRLSRWPSLRQGCVPKVWMCTGMHSGDQPSIAWHHRNDEGRRAQIPDLSPSSPVP